jgi:hypothetical protein
MDNYFLSQPMIEDRVLGIERDNYIEGPDCHGIIEIEHMKKLIHKNFEDSYLALQTHYLVYFTSIILHAIRNISIPEIRKYIFDEK